MASLCGKKFLVFSGLVVLLYVSVCSAKAPVHPVVSEHHDQCRKVPVRIQQTCHKDVVKKEPYQCDGGHSCVEEPVEVHATCSRPVTKKEAYSCPKTTHQEVCHKVPVTKEEVCYREALRQEPYACDKPKKVCKDVTVDVPSTCTKHTTKKEAYVCPDQKCEKTPVESICKKSVSQPFNCSKTEYKEVCEDDVVEVDGHCDTNWSEEAYDCSTIEYKSECRGTNVLYGSRSIPMKKPMKGAVRSLRSKTSHEAMKAGRVGNHSLLNHHEIKADLRKRGSTMAIHGGRHHGRGALQMHEQMKAELRNSMRGHEAMKGMGRRGGKSLLHQHEQMKRDARGGQRRGMFHQHEQMKRAARSGLSKGGLQGHESMKASMREHMRQKRHASPATKGGMCRDVPVKVHKTCYRKVPVQNGHCKRVVKHATKCKKVPVEVPSTCYKSVQVDEKCTTHVEKCQPRMCHREVPHVQHYDCTKPQTVRKCSVATNLGTCYKDVKVKESYDCSKTSYVERCEDVPTVRKDTCYRTVNGHEKYPCTKTELKKKCMHSPKICYRSRTEQEAYDCSRTEYKNECQSLRQPLRSEFKVGHSQHVQKMLDGFGVRPHGALLNHFEEKLHGERQHQGVRDHFERKTRGGHVEQKLHRDFNDSHGHLESKLDVTGHFEQKFHGARSHLDKGIAGVRGQGRGRFEQKLHGGARGHLAHLEQKLHRRSK